MSTDMMPDSFHAYMAKHGTPDSPPQNGKPRVILLNGPPECGKDTAAAMLKQSFGQYAHIEKFARPVKEGCHGLFGIVDDKGRVLRHDAFELVKNEPNAEFLGLSPRQAYIWYSEVVMKPKFGQSIFGNMAVANMRRWLSNFQQDVKKGILLNVPPVFLISDSGFAVETDPVVEEFGACNVLLIRLYRDGKTFAADSRSYIDPPSIKKVDVVNCGTSAFKMKLIEVVENWEAGTR